MAERDEQLDPFLAEVASELRRPVRVDAAFDARVMAALEPSVIPLPGFDTRKRSRPWLLRPRTFSLTPLAGFAAAAALTSVVVLGAYRIRHPGDAVTVAPVPAGYELTPVANVTAITPTLSSVPFTLKLPGAKSVTVIGDFNEWDPAKTPLTKISEKDDLWAVSVMLPPGQFQYQFVVDGEKRLVDPAAPQSVKSEFGDANSVVTVGAGGIR